MSELATVAERLAAAGVRVKPLGWETVADFAIEAVADKRLYVVLSRCGGDLHMGVCDRVLEVGTRDECIAACEAHHAAAVLAMLEVVLAMLEVVPSEEPQS